MTTDWRYRRLRLRLRWARWRRPPASVASVLEGRAAFEAMGSLLGVPAGASCTPAVAGGVPVEWMSVASSAPDRVVLYLHGGAYTMGSVNASRTMLGMVLEAARARGCNVDYRLAPEHPFPAALDDALAAYRGVLDAGVDPTRVGLVGDSAGGGLALAMLVAARDAGLPLPAAAVLTSPWADLALRGRSYATRARRDLALSRDLLEVSARCYLDGADPSDPRVSPLHAPLHGLPPLLVLVGTEEIVHDDAVTIVEGVRRAGGEAELLVGEGMIHCWTGYVDDIDRAREDLRRVGRFLRDRIPDRDGALEPPGRDGPRRDTGRLDGNLL